MNEEGGGEEEQEKKIGREVEALNTKGVLYARYGIMVRYIYTHTQVE
jgi:hypothetical protein